MWVRWLQASPRCNPLVAMTKRERLARTRGAAPTTAAHAIDLDDIDIREARVYAIPLTTRFRGITIREGMVIEGPAGWGEFRPFREYDDRESASWLATAVEAATVGWPEPVRDRVPINATVPVVGPQRAHEIVSASGCATAKVKIDDHPGSLGEDLARVEAVRDALGPHGHLRVDANGGWDTDTAVTVIPRLDKAAGGLEYVEQPCRTIDELAIVRRKVAVRIAADESIRRVKDPLRVAVIGAADIAVIQCTPLGAPCPCCTAMWCPTPAHFDLSAATCRCPGPHPHPIPRCWTPTS